jgi:hypothetical protein
MSFRVGLCAFTMLALSMGAYTQVDGYSIDLNRTNFETGVALPSPESFATVKVKCNFDDWSKTVEWGDGKTETLTHTVQASLPGPSTPAGTYPIYSTHSYGKAGTYNASTKLVVHCVGGPPGPGGLVDKKSYTITVFDRLPLNSLTASSAVVKRGATVDVTAETFADAPASGTRVNLTANKPNVFGSGALSVNTDIPEHSKTTSATLKVSSTAPLGAVTVTATAGNQLNKNIRIVP